MKFLIFYLLFVGTSFALEVDERLTMRIVSTSESRKTILINRGIEDGLAKGDHAKFFVSEGVIARGVCIKLSPTRSVWSMYRLVNTAFLKDDQVMKLKITPAVKITKDESRMLVKDDKSSKPADPRELGIPLAEGADDLAQNSNTNQQINADLIQNRGPISLLNKNLEVFGMFSYSQYAQTSDPSSGTASSSADVTNMSLLGGGEWYFKNANSFLQRISIVGQFMIERTTVMGHLGTILKEESTSFGGGATLYPLTLPSKAESFIPYANYTLMIGSTKSTFTSGNESSAADTDLSASVLSHKFAFGMKYYSEHGLGVRVEMSYMMRADQYEEDSSTISYLVKKIGPRFLVGIGYRF